MVLTKILEGFIFIYYKLKIFTNRSFVYKLYAIQFVNKSVTIMGTNICKIRANTQTFFQEFSSQLRLYFSQNFMANRSRS